LDRYPALDLIIDRESASPDLEDQILATIDDFSPLAIQEREDGGWRVFFPTGGERDRAACALDDPRVAGLTRIQRVEVPDEDWARRTQASLTAVRIGRLIVAPPWDHPRNSPAPTLAPRPDDITIEIDPSMGFGTGHHATTRLCLDLLQRLPLDNARVIDVGTGSGVLAIASALLGATEIIAIDHDADALANARANIERNQARIEVRQVDLSEVESERFDVALANLTSAVILRHADALARLVKSGGRLVLSGFGPADADDVANAFGLRPVETLADEGWVALLLQR